LHGVLFIMAGSQLPHTQLHDHDQSPTPLFHRAFLGDEAEQHVAGNERSGDTFIARGNARQIGHVNNVYNGPTHQYFDTRGPLEHSSVLEWLWPRSPDPHSPIAASFAKQGSIHNSATDARKGQPEPWLLSRRKYHEWLNGDSGCLWVRGKGERILTIPNRPLIATVGCGKTVLFSAIIRQIQGLQPSQRLGYYYCRFQNDNSEELSLILRRWLVQTCDRANVPKALQDVHKTCHQYYPPTEPTTEELEEALLESLRTYTETSHQKVYLLVDALDELTIDDGQNVEVLDMLCRLSDARLPNVHLLAVSRDWPEIGEYLMPSFNELEIDYNAVDEEIRAFVPRAIASSPRLRRQSQETKVRIENRLVEQANGM
jgi:hypothetical protein